MATVEMNHKNNVFCLLYRDKSYLLSLYNAVNETNYQDEEALEVVTLDAAICMRMHNDAAFIVASTLNLYEQQSTVNANMPLRNLYYIAEELKKIIPVDKLYRTSKVKIPAPMFVTFYNGTDRQPEESVFKLSDLYEVKQGEPALELIVRQININRGQNETMKHKCESLRGYAEFVDRVRDRTTAGMKVEIAVSQTVDECIQEGILSDFFQKHKSEVINMGIFEFDAELYEKAIREDGWEAGHEEGFAAGIAEGKAVGIAEGLAEGLTVGKTDGLIAGKLESILELLEELGPVPDSLRQKIAEEKNLDVLKKWHKLSAKAASLEEFEQAIQ